MRYGIFSILRITTFCAVVLVPLRIILKFEPQLDRALPLFLLIYAFLGVPMATIFASKLGSHPHLSSIPLALFLFRLWLCDLAAIFVFVVWMQIGFAIW